MAGIDSSSEFVRQLIKRRPTLPILIIGQYFPDGFEAHPGRLLFIGSDFPDRPLLSRDFRFIRADSTEEITRAAEQALAGFTSNDYELVFIDHDHRLDNIVEHIAAALRLTAERAVFLFDDAVPPEIAMAGPAPTQAWWVGEVWMLKHLLRPAGPGFFCAATALPATGLLVAAGFAPLTMAEVAPLYPALSAVNDDEAFRGGMDLKDPLEVFSGASAALNAGASQDNLALDAGGSAGDGWLFTRRTIRDSGPWEKPAPEFFLDLSTGGHDLTKHQHGRLQAAAKYIDTFQDCHLIGFSGLVKDAKYFDHWLNTGDDYLRGIASATETYANHYTGITMRDEQPSLPPERLAEAVRIDEPVMFGTPDEPDNWGMWLLLGLPSLYEFLQNRDRYEKFMGYVLQPWQRKFLAAAGLPPDDLIEHHRAKSYFCREISTIRKSYRDMFISEDEMAIFQSFARTMAETAAGPRRVFLSRLTRTEKLGSYRGLLNERELIAALQKLDFAIAEPEYMPFAEQVALFRGADVVVGLGGAGMFNVIFCKPGTRVVTIESGVGFLNAHTNIFGSMGFQYGVILGEEDPTDPRPDQRRWRLDVPRAVSRIAEFL
jgi:hypothetical protein